MFAEIFSIHMMATALITILQHSAKHTHTDEFNLTKAYISTEQILPTPLTVGRHVRSGLL